MVMEKYNKNIKYIYEHYIGLGYLINIFMHFIGFAHLIKSTIHLLKWSLGKTKRLIIKWLIQEDFSSVSL